MQKNIRLSSEMENFNEFINKKINIFKLNEGEVAVNIENLIKIFDIYAIIVKSEDIEIIGGDTISISFTSSNLDGDITIENLSKLEKTLNKNQLVDFIKIDTNKYFIYISFDLDYEIGLY